MGYRMKVNVDNVLVYLKYSFDTKAVLSLKWVLHMFAMVVDEEFEDQYIVKKNNELYGKLEDTSILLASSYDGPLLIANQEVDINKGFLSNIEKNITTTYGRLVMNYLVSIYCFHGKIPYLNEKFTLKDIENKYILKMLSDTEDTKDNITIAEYKIFMDVGLYIESFSKYLSIAVTEKTALPPPGLKEFKKKTIKQLTDKYGKDFAKNPIAIAELEKLLMEFDDDYLKDDPSYGKLISGKVKNMARKKMFLLFGIGNGFEDNIEGVTDSLDDGWDLDPKKLAQYANDSRAGSYGRGIETQKGGVVAKVSLRATSDLKIIKTDCKSVVGLTTHVTSDNYLSYVNRYMIAGTSVKLLDEKTLLNLIGKDITLRTALYCQLENDFCSTCLGDNIKDYKNGISLLVNGVGGKILKLALAVFHGVSLKIGKLDTATIK